MRAPLRVLGGVVVEADDTILRSHITTIQDDIEVLIILVIGIHGEGELSVPFRSCRNNVGLSQCPERSTEIAFTNLIVIIHHAHQFLWCISLSDRIYLCGYPLWGIHAIQFTALTTCQSQHTKGSCTESGCYFIESFHN